MVKLARRPKLAFDTLEERRLLSVTPGVVYETASYIDADGDSVSISITGAAGEGAGFTVELAGLASDNADAQRINLVGLTADNGIQIVVTPQELAFQPGTAFATMFSAGYTNVTLLSADNATTALGGIQLSAAVVHSISLAGVDVGSITLDAGEAPYADRINTQNNQQATDSTMYNPVTGLIDLGGITAASIDSLVINGAISAPTKNPFDTSVTNDFRSIVNVSGRIGSVVGLRSSLSGAIRADSIGSVRVAAIAGEITTRAAEEPLAINLPSAFKGFINSAGHLHLGFPLSDGALITGQITAGGGISGSDRDSQADTIFIPGGYVGSLVSLSPTIGVADIAVDGEAALGIFSAASVGSLSADAFTAEFVVEAAGSIGAVEAGFGSIEGHLQAGMNIGPIKAVRSILGTMIAGGTIGTITTVEGGLQSLSIQAGGSVGPLSLYQGMLGTSIVAGSNIEAVTIPVGGIAASFLRGANIGNVTVTDGSIVSSSLIATNDIGNVSAFGSLTGVGIGDVSLVAGRDIGTISGSAHIGAGIEALKAEAGRAIAGIVGFSAGEFGTLAGAGIIDTNVVANTIGPISGRSAGGSGIEASVFTSRVGGIGAVTGDGWLDGLRNVVVVAQTDIAAITGIAKLDGSGIFGGSYDANQGGIGLITAEGGANGGFGIVGARFQATDAAGGGIAGITTSANANGLHAFADSTVHASSIGPIQATVLGGVFGSGLVGGDIRAFSGPIASIDVRVNSTGGVGILDGKIRASGDIGPMTVVAFNNSAIVRGEFTSRGNFGNIYAESTRGGNAIDGAFFSAPGQIVALDPFIPPPDVEAFDPLGNFGSITAFAGGTDAASNAIVDVIVTAIGDIGQVTATSKGGGGILRSSFTADSDGDFTPQSFLSPRPWLAAGSIEGITVVTAGRQLTASSGIVDSTFTAALIGDVYVDVQTVEGGDAIARSTFTGRTAVYDGFGNYDNTGSIGNVFVRNRSSSVPGIGVGIDTSAFLAGAAGRIGNISVTTSGATGIFASTFFADVPDLDQNLFTSTIGTITVDTGRVLQWTLLPAGITLSSFVAAAGIGNVTVDSVGAGITASAFIADFDYLGQGNESGPLGNITVRVPGRFASGVTGSLFSGSSIGNISVRLTDNAQNGFNAVALSAFTAWTGAIGNVTIVHSQTGLPYALGAGNAVLTSVWTAATGIGAVTISGRAVGAVFIVTGVPVVMLASPGDAGALAGSPSIGSVTVTTTDTAEITLDTAGPIGNLTFSQLAGGGNISLALAATQIGDITVSAPGSVANADLSLNARSPIIGAIAVDGNLTLQAQSTTTLGNVTVGGNASLTAALLTNLGNLAVNGMLTLPQGLGSLRTAGSFSAGSLASVAKGRTVQIGAKGSTGSSIGRVTIGQGLRKQGVYQFAFATFTGQPSAVVGGKSVNAAKGKGRLVDGVRLIGSPPPPSSSGGKVKRR
jgi:hypothetical protein